MPCREEVPDLEADERRQFEEATLPHLDPAYNLARWLTQDEHAAEDVVQEAYFRAARYFGRFRGGEGRPWLLSVVRRASFDWQTGIGKHRNDPGGPPSHDAFTRRRPGRRHQRLEQFKK